mmetsp:Transcript_103142/g.182810  ORF Transcript_103142/g.182810 Transcript_103142/m.182810 type:complete len:305 (+) Transcript_103142:640-1554(+)
MKLKRWPWVVSNMSLNSFRRFMTPDMSTSWKVVRNAVLLCDPFRLFAMVLRMRLKRTRLSARLSAGAAAAGVGDAAAGAAGAAGAAAAGAGVGTAATSGAAAPAGGAPPRVIVQSSFPTSTVESTSALISVTVPASSASTSTVTLSVSINTRSWPFFTKSPALTFHSMMLPSVMESAPKAGVLTTIFSPEGGAAAAAGAAAAGAAAGAVFSACGAGAEAVPPSLRVQSGESTSTVASIAACISITVPPASAITSTVTLSVSIIARRSPFFTTSPTFTFHSIMLPSVMESAPNGGVLTTCPPLAE